MEILDIVKIAAKAADSKKAEDTQVIEITDLTIIADYFVITSGSSTTQIRAIADEIEYKLSEAKVEPLHIEGIKTGWICLDYGNVVIHVLSREQRNYFQLERLWGDGKSLNIDKLLED